MRLNNLELDPDQGTYFINSTDETYQNFIKDNFEILDKTDWIMPDWVSDSLYYMEVGAKHIDWEGGDESFNKCELKIDLVRKIIKIIRLED